MINRTIKLLMFSDIFVTTGFGLVEPILAIYINQGVQGGSVFAAGLASTLFLGTKSVIQLPFARYVDARKDGEDVRWLILGSFFIAFVPFLYMFATHINHIFFAQFIYGIGAGLAFPTWLKLWSTHLDKHHEGFEWSLYSTLVGLGVAATAAIGAALAQFIGFRLTFFVVGCMSLIGCGVLFYLRQLMQEPSSGKRFAHYQKLRRTGHKKN